MGKLLTYQSCFWLHDHIEFGHTNDLHVCCYTFVDTAGCSRGAVKLVKIEGDTFPADEIKAARRRIHEEIAADRQDDCRECRYLETRDWPEKPYLTDVVTMNLWTHCNLKCVYCFTLLPEFTNKRVTYDIEAVIRSMLNGGHLNPKGSVVWGGGDISALPEFNAASQMFQDYGVRQDIKTSGFKFLKGVADALRKNLATLEVSIDAGTRDTYTAYKGRDAFDRVVENLMRYRECGPVQLKYIAGLTNVTDADIEGFVNLAAAVRPTSILITAEMGAAFTRTYGDPAIRQVARLIDACRALDTHVSPMNDAEGNMRFPNVWPEIADMIPQAERAPAEIT